MSTFRARPSELPGGLRSLLGDLSLIYWLGIWGISGIGAPLPKSLGSCVILWEYLLFTRSAVLSAFCGLSRGASSLFPDRVDSFEGRPELESVAAASPAGIGALICRGALIWGGGPPLGRFSVRFLRSEMPFPRSSDILPARSIALVILRGVVSPRALLRGARPVTCSVLRTFNAPDPGQGARASLVSCRSFPSQKSSTPSHRPHPFSHSLESSCASFLFNSPPVCFYHITA